MDTCHIGVCGFDRDYYLGDGGMLITIKEDKITQLMANTERIKLLKKDGSYDGDTFIISIEWIDKDTTLTGVIFDTKEERDKEFERIADIVDANNKVLVPCEMVESKTEIDEQAIKDNMENYNEYVCGWERRKRT